MAQKRLQVLKLKKLCPVEEVVSEAPSVEELEEAVAESVDESQIMDDMVTEEQVVVAEDIASSAEVIEADPEDLETIRARMDSALGIDGTEPIESSENTNLEMVAEADPEGTAESEVSTQPITASEHVVEQGDTLYAIAKSAKQSDSVSVNQMMIAIQQANPNAFIRENINPS